ncbi:Polyphosphate kinase [Rhizoctonia solani]|uniref:Polyphosphate kinase n=1 Tax=Rhizoctonia solani TaxID=456999 RepID=A0A0K6FUJ0_9AGAM|nr:Polyphosphate kinase [Rhizoctonia solani]
MSRISPPGEFAPEICSFRDGTRHIPFHYFACAFLPRQVDDHAVAAKYQQLPEFRTSYTRFHQLTSISETTSVRDPLVQLMNHIVDSERGRLGISDSVPLYFTSSTSTHGIKSSAGICRPEICGVQRLRGSDEPVTWSIVSIVCDYMDRNPPGKLLDDSLHTFDVDAQPQIPEPPSEIPYPSKQSHSFSNRPVSISEQGTQLDRYLLEMRSHQVTRDAVLGILFMGSYASFWYADSDSTVKSQFIPVDSSRFICALMYLARADPVQLGYSPYFRTINGAVLISQSINGARFVKDETAVPGTVYELHDVLSLAHELHGRCARVLGATRPGSQENYVLKLSYQVTSREHEGDLIQRAWDRGVDGIVRLYGYFTLQKLSEGPRSRLPPDLIPGMPHHLLVEDRELRVLVLARCIPLFRVSEPRTFLTASISLLHTICDLYARGDILHRDISVHNLMVQVENPSVGVLIDLDHAIDMRIQNNQNASSLHRVGTLPFTALDLLHNAANYPRHLRHDLESFVYVLFWIAARYESGAEVNTLIFNEWGIGDWAAIVTAKQGFIALMTHLEFTPTPGFDFLAMELFAFRQLLGNAHHAIRAKFIKDNLKARGLSHSERRCCPVAGTPYPEQLEGLNRETILSILNASLARLGQ